MRVTTSSANEYRALKVSIASSVTNLSRYPRNHRSPHSFEHSARRRTSRGINDDSPRLSAARCCTSKCNGSGAATVVSRCWQQWGSAATYLAYLDPPRHIDSNQNYFRPIIVRPRVNASPPACLQNRN